VVWSGRVGVGCLIWSSCSVVGVMWCGWIALLLLELEAEETVILIVVHCPVSGRRWLDCRKYLVVVCRRYPCC
jgi:hypothetical protein